MSGKAKASKTFTRNITLVIAALVVGIALFTAVFVSATAQNTDEAVEALKEITEYVKTQCTLEHEATFENEAKSLVNLVDKTREARNYINYGALDETEESLSAFASEHRLSGIILTDDNAEKRIAAFYCSDGATADEWRSTLDKYKGAGFNLAKSYSERTTADNGYYVDFAVVGREDKQGLILCYTRQSAELAVTLQYSIKNILEGYSFGAGGIIVVTDGTRVVATNVDRYMGRDVADVSVIENVAWKASDDNVRKVIADGNKYFALKGRSTGYYVYALTAEKDVYQRRTFTTTYAMVLYVLVVAIIAAVLRLFDHIREEEQRKADAENAAKIDALAREAIRANRAKTEFLRRMSHDIRTPINGIRGMLKIADYYVDDPDKQRECREKMWQASGYLLDLVNDVLDMSKLDAGNMVVAKEEFVMTDVLAEAEIMIKTQAIERGVELKEFSVSVEHDRLFGAAILLKRTLVNILSNAVKYNRPGGFVRLETTETASDDKTARFKIVVADNGTGMSEEFMKVMYEPFAQEYSDPSGSARNGAGLGLSIVKKAVEIMGGEISVASEKDKGTTFTLDLPFEISDGTEIPHASATDDKPLCGLNILLAEDNDLNREFAEFILATRGATVTSATNGREAVEKFVSSPAGTFDLAIMDVMMPVTDGIEATKAIRNSDKPGAGAIPIIAMTANGFADDVERVLAAGMNAHISKPVDADKLVETILRIVGKKR